MATHKLNLTEAQLAIGLSIATFATITAGLGIRMYGMAESFTSDAAACTAHGIACFLHLAMVLGIVAIAYFAYLFGVGKVGLQSSTASSKDFLSIKDFLVQGSTIVGILLCIFIAAMTGLSYFGIYMGVASWKDISTVCKNMDSAFDPETVADGISITLVVLFSLASLGLVLYIVYPIVMQYRGGNKIKA